MFLRSDLREAVTRLRSAEVNAVSSVLKLYFRELPEPLVPAELFHRLANMLGKLRPPPFQRRAILCSGNTICQLLVFFRVLKL